jgi:hypothetical protein
MSLAHVRQGSLFWAQSRLVQLGVNNSIAIQGFSAQLPECFASDFALIRHLDQVIEKDQLSIYLRRETLAALWAQGPATRQGIYPLLVKGRSYE